MALERDTPLRQFSREDIFDKDSIDTDFLNSQLTLTGLSLLKDYMVSLSTELSPTRNFPLHVLQKYLLIDLFSEELRNIIFSSRPPCRWQEIEHSRRISHGGRDVLVKIVIILDIAHNQPAIEALMNKVHSKLKNKKIRSMKVSLS